MQAGAVHPLETLLHCCCSSTCLIVTHLTCSRPCTIFDRCLRCRSACCVLLDIVSVGVLPVCADAVCSQIVLCCLYTNCLPVS